MSPLLQQFITDSHDILERMSQALLALEKNPGDEGVIDELFRAVHTLKGNSGLFDIPTFTRVVHAAEDLLDKVRDKELSIDNDLTDELLESMDFIQRMVDMVEASGAIPDDFTDEADARIERLRALLPESDGHDLVFEEPADQVQPPDTLDWIARIPEAERLDACLASGGYALSAIRYVPEPECFFKGEDPLLLLRNLPGRQAFLISPIEPYSAQAEINVYRSNFELQALSTASPAEIRDHFRYMPEQVAVYAVPPTALAIAVGEDLSDDGLRDDFLANAETLLAKGDVALLAVAAGAVLDLISPDLKTASMLRFIRQLALAGAEVPVLSALVKALATGEVPSLDIADAAAESLQDAVPPAAPAPRVKSAGASGLGRNTLAVQIVTTQRQLLDLPVPPDQWDGRLLAIGNTLRSLLAVQGGSEAVAALEAVLSTCAEERSFLSLAFHLEALLPSGDDDSDDPPKDFAPPASIATAAAPVRSDAASADTLGDAPKAATEHGDKSARVLKVPQEKVDRLMDLIGEMVVAKNALPYLATKAEEVYGSRDLAREIKAQFAVINRIAEDMQDGIMQVRMLPMSSVFQRFPRLVRDVARQLGKRVRLVLEGEEAEADKHIVESLGDPLIHILRNSLDHGLETPEARRAAGKPEEGRITVRASQEGDRVLIEIEDDGKGIDPAVIKRKAFEKGLIDETRLESISDQEAIQLVFAPGFSTAETVSNLSGRGVGMDVVKNSLEKIGGQVRLTSEKGRGTRIALTLPLSVAVSNVLMVKMNGQRFGVPMDVVVETVRVPRDEIHVIKGRRVSVLRGKIVPLFGADELLSLPEAPIANAEGEYAVLVVRVDGATVGMIVDGFAQTTDVILKPLEGPLSGLAGFAGSALLGDGSVLLVLDMKELMNGA